ncbi:MAG TPA: hypothetical protein VE379_06220 [Vicinamibacterales bacterium]|jgi:hypothetical protein|nr:hypothetical protein [Vicinamibacterales bacterium]
MLHRRPSLAAHALLSALLAAAGAATSVAAAAPSQPAERRSAQPAPTVAERPPVALNVDAEGTRRDLMELLRKHPPAVARVLKTDPSLLRNDAYMSGYPALQHFLTQHPEVQQNAAFYFGEIHEGDWQPPTPRMRMIEGTLAALGGFTAFIVVLGTLIWLIRTVMDQRRWTRLSRIQAEVHSKLMDRFSNHDELMSYVQTPAGRRFLESGPSPLQEAAPSVGAPLSRILWSTQIGVVALGLGLGLLFVSGRTIEELHELLFITGCLSVALGAGFTVSAAVSYVISRKLGLMGATAADHA